MTEQASFRTHLAQHVRQHLLKDFWTDQDATTIVLRRKDLKISGEALRFLTMKTILAVEFAYYDFIVARYQGDFVAVKPTVTASAGSLSLNEGDSVTLNATVHAAGCAARSLRSHCSCALPAVHDTTPQFEFSAITCQLPMSVL